MNLEDAYRSGYMTAAGEIHADKASRLGAKERGVAPWSCDQSHRIAWDRGYDAACCAYRLGHDPLELAQAGLFTAALETTASIVEKLLDEPGFRNNCRPDPRR